LPSTVTFRSLVTGLIWHQSQRTGAAVERGAGHPEVAHDLCRRLSGFYESIGVADLSVRNSPWPATKVLASRSAPIDRVEHSLTLDFVLHLPQSSHGREHHMSRRCRRADISAAKIEDPKLNPAAAQAFGKREHVLRRFAQPVQRREHECVTRLKRGDSDIKLRTSRSSSGIPFIDLEVVTPDAGRQDIGPLFDRGTVPSRYSRVTDQLLHNSPSLSHN
jgi:hypothetical protein